MTDEEREKELKDAKERADAAEKRADAAEKERDDASKRADTVEKADKARQDAEEAEKTKAAQEKEKMDAAKRDSRKDRHAKHDGDGKGEVLDCAKCDSEEKEEEEKERADKARKDAEALVEAGRGTEDIKDSANKMAAMQKQIDELTRSNQPLTVEDRNELAKAFHRYDSLFQMLLDTTPQPLPGEGGIAYRKRCASNLRKYTQSFKNYVFHDSQQPEDFGLVENAIFSEASSYAKNPPAADIEGQVREIKDSTTLPGKVITTFVGDPHAVWAPFKAPVQRFLKKVNKPQQQHAAY